MIQSKKGKKIKTKSTKHTENGYVYVATNSLYEAHNLYKIGYTKDVLSRMNALSRQNVFKMYPVLIFKFKDSRKMEKKIHDEYKMWRVRKDREYFYLDKYVLRELKDRFYEFLFADENFIAEDWYSVGFFDIGKEAEAMWSASWNYL